MNLPFLHRYSRKLTPDLGQSVSYVRLALFNMHPDGPGYCLQQIPLPDSRHHLRCILPSIAGKNLLQNQRTKVFIDINEVTSGVADDKITKVDHAGQI